MSYDKTKFAERLNEICRLKTADPQKALQKLTKKSQPSVWDWLHAETMPDRENMLKIIIWADTTSDYLLYARGPRRPDWISKEIQGKEAANDLPKRQAAKVVRRRTKK